MEESNVRFDYRLTGCGVTSPEILEAVTIRIDYRPDQMDKQSQPGSHYYTMRPQQARDIAKRLIE